MTTGQVRVSSEWLTLREPVDAASRALDLVEELRSFLPTDGGATVHDLGCGTGSMARWLAGQLTGPQHWVMYDRDAELLARAAADSPEEAADGAPVTIETRRRDITRLEPGELAGAALITASALLDMMTAEELERLVAICAAASCPVLITLSVTGRVDLIPADPFDRCVMESFNAHQRRITGARRLLGPDAVGFAVDGFTRMGIDVLVRPSPWRLGPAQAALATEWLTGWLAAAGEQRPELGAVALSYARRRLTEAAAGTLSVTVHHQDLLALPRRGSRCR
jgi:SAM-dependent methyltransferase